MKTKTMVSLLLALLLCIGMVSGASASESEEIVYWNFFTGPDGATMSELVDGFNATNPAYTIKSVTMDSGDLYTKIPTVVATREGKPDVCIGDVAPVAYV